ncbi:MAG TPA: rhomboid family intramembrane serine protease [Candidatus Binatia bacterium]|nr:rhomboid family intramembrane serine protease [Candidatus Binatia bacterium]
MIPLRDTIPSRRVPLVNHLLIAANVGVFLYELSLGSRMEHFVLAHGLVPRTISAHSVLTSMFLHGSWFHVLANMLYLWIFGDNVEDRLGHLRYVLFYLLCGAAAAVAQTLTNPHSTVPMVGASGAIAGVTGAYLLFFPRARIVTLVPVLFFIQVVEVPAVFFLLFWFVMQLAAGLQALGVRQSLGGVAFWAHVGGFVAGLVLGPLFARRPRRVV